MTPAEINSYVGKPWVAGGRGPEAFDCYGLLRDVQARFYGRSLPDASVGAGGTAAQVYAQCMASGDWQLVDLPFDGAGVLLRGGSDPHVGVWLANDGGGILHSLEGSGIWFHRLPMLRIHGFARIKFYKFNA